MDPQTERSIVRLENRISRLESTVISLDNENCVLESKIDSLSGQLLDMKYKLSHG